MGGVGFYLLSHMEERNAVGMSWETCHVVGVRHLRSRVKQEEIRFRIRRFQMNVVWIKHDQCKRSTYRWFGHIWKWIKIELQIKYMKKAWQGGEWWGDQKSCSWVKIITFLKRSENKKQCMYKRWWKHGSFSRTVRWSDMVWNTFSRYPLYLSQVVVIGGRGQTLGITVIGCHKAWHATQLQYHINT